MQHVNQFPENEKGPLVPLYMPQNTMDRTKDIDYYICDFSLKCIMGIYNHNAFYINCHEKGETLGSGEGLPPDELSMKIEGAGLMPKHCKILYNKDHHEYTIELLNPDAEVWVCINKSTDLKDYIKKDTDVVSLQCGSYKYDVSLSKKKSDVNDLNLWIIENNLSQLRSVFNENGIKTLNDINENMPKLKTIISDTLWGQLTTAVNNTKADISLVFKYYKTNPSDAKEEQITNSQKLEIPPTPDSKKRALYTIAKMNNSYKICINESSEKQKKLYRRIRADEKYKLSADDDIIISKLTFKVQRLNAGVHTDRGSHTDNEDTFALLQNVNVIDSLMFSLFGIFDGHGDDYCAKFVRDHYPRILASELIDRQFSISSSANTCIYNSLIEACVKTDLEFFKEKTSLASGSAAAWIFIVGNRVFSCNVGDCRVVLCKKGEAVNLTNDQKATRQDEQERIKRLKGEISLSRLYSKLAISRSFGDFNLKQRYKKEIDRDMLLNGVLIVKPEIRMTEIDPFDDEFIVIASDGLWDKFTSQDCVNFIKDNMKSMTESDKNIDKICKAVVEEAVKRKSRDNVTATIIMLNRGIKKA